MHKVPTTHWKEVEVSYLRRSDGTETLAVPACTVSAEEWSARPIGPPPFLVPGDLQVSGTWNMQLRAALQASIDGLFAYKPPSGLDIEMSLPARRGPGRPRKTA